MRLVLTTNNQCGQNHGGVCCHLQIGIVVNNSIELVNEYSIELVSDYFECYATSDQLVKYFWHMFDKYITSVDASNYQCKLSYSIIVYIH